MKRAVDRGQLVLLGLFTAVIAASVVWHPSDDGGFVICPFRLATGIPCPGCGLTRSFCAVAKGDVERGFELHWLGPLLFAVLCVYWLRGVAILAGYTGAVARFDAFVSRWRVVYVGFAVLFVVWVVRLVVLGYSGQLTNLAHEGALYRVF